MLGAIVNGLGELTFGSIATLLDAAPAGVRCLFADIGALTDFALSPGKRTCVRRNLRGVGGSAGRSDVLNIFRHHAANMVEMFASSRWNPEEVSKRIESADTGILDEALEEQRGIILVTVHIGNWELAARFFSHRGYGMNVVAGVQMNRFLTSAVKRAKERQGIRVINPEHSYRRLFKALSSNELVALLLDGDIYKGGTEVELFSRRLRMPRGAVRLSARSGAPVIGGFCRRVGRERYRIHLERILSADECRSGPEEEMQKRLYRRIEDFIASNSDQWCIFRDFLGDGR
jgi:KDO2-lipid IV(A) lauroyltransferase